ncbi:MarR family winged helix-turn-helix transcriptional regulator [Microbacterium sulfonylureivorans]|uniref:MarR family winged helix-turn-helix transcriptional regulator n=1 Tax=Microbacterium sulfonylureivorans TaxID=2486854 RepID=UPI000FDC789A|nr:MarR family transcriptional regulator [Microbacterium sulfonylureivorans]
MSTKLPAPFPHERGTRRWLSEDEERSWRAFRRMMTAVTERTAHDLAPTGLSMPDYEVLSTLVDREEHRWGLRDMAAKMEWSRSRLSRQISRMQARGLVDRHADDSDGRSVVLELTESGYAALRAATATHLASVRRRFVDRLTPEELVVLRGLAERVSAPE